MGGEARLVLGKTHRSASVVGNTLEELFDTLLYSDELLTPVRRWSCEGNAGQDECLRSHYGSVSARCACIVQ